VCEHVIPLYRRVVVRRGQRAVLSVQYGELTRIGHVFADLLKLIEGQYPFRLLVDRLEVTLQQQLPALPLDQLLVQLYLQQQV